VLIQNRASFVPASALEIGALTSDDDFALLEGEWRALAGRAFAPTPFCSYEWIAICWEKLRAGDGTRLYVVTAREAGRLVFVLPLFETRGLAGFRTLGLIDSGTPFYGDLLMEDSAAGRKAAEAVAAFLERQRSIRRIRLNCVLEDAAAHHFLAACSAKPKKTSPVRRLYTADYAGWEDFLRRMNARSRQNFNSRKRMLEKLGRLAFDRVENLQEADSEVAQIFAWKRTALGDELRTSHWLLAEDTERLFRKAAARGLGSVYRLTLDERTIAAYLGFHSAGGLHLSKTSFDPALSKYGPGRVCRLLLVQHAFENGVGFLDLMTGSFPWKMSMSSRQTSCTNYRVPGRLFTWLPV
jgi:CelD/BcsL family acetyltransferase involved in cellulose biosynthesis